MFSFWGLAREIAKGINVSTFVAREGDFRLGSGLLLLTLSEDCRSCSRATATGTLGTGR